MSSKNTNTKDNELKNIKPTTLQLKDALDHEMRKQEYKTAFAKTIGILVAVAAFSVLIASFFVKVQKISGESMYPTLSTGQIVIAFKTDTFEPGQLVAFYYNNKVLIKRVIGSPGDWINIDSEGNVTVNGVVLDEPYLTEKSLEPTDIEFPYQVPESRYFVLGDNRSVSIDSRSDVVGCISKEQLIGHVLFRIYPFGEFGIITNN